MGMEKAGGVQKRVHSPVNLSGKIGVVACEFPGATKKGGALGRIIKHVTSELYWKLGIKSAILLPYSLDVDKEVLSNETPDYFEGKVDGIPVYALKDLEGNEFFPHLYPTAEASREEIQNYLKGIGLFGKKLWGLIAENKNWETSLIHAWDDWMGWILALRGSLYHVRTIFTPVDPQKFRQAFTAKETDDTVINGHVANLHQFAANQLTGFMVGVENANLITISSEMELNQLMNGTSQYKEFLSDAINKGRHFHVLDKYSSWHPRQETLPPSHVISRFGEAYYHALYGRGHDLVLNLREAIKNSSDTAYPPKEVKLYVTEWPDMRPRKEIIQDAMDRKSIPKVRDIKVISGGDAVVEDGWTAYRDNIGAFVKEIFSFFFTEKEIMAGDFSRINEVVKKLNEDNEAKVAITSGGESSRLQAISGGAGAGKGPLIIGIYAKERKMPAIKSFDDLAIEQATLDFAAQLPDMGKGYLIMGGNDNGLLGYGLWRAGRGILAEVKGDIILVGQSKKIRGASIEDPEVNKLKELGLLFSEPKDGELLLMSEKLVKKDGHFDLQTAEELLLKNGGGDSVAKNTFYMAMKIKRALVWALLYSRPSSHSDYKHMINKTYPLDFSLCFSTPATTEKIEDWRKIRELPDPKTGKYIKLRGREIKQWLTVEDWDYIWHAAKLSTHPTSASLIDFWTKYEDKFHPEVKKFIMQVLTQSIDEGRNGKKTGIYVADIGELAKWADYGTPLEYYEKPMETTATGEKRKTSRGIHGFPLSTNSVATYDQGVTYDNPNSVFSAATVFAKGGKVGSNVLLLFNFFDEEVTIPDNTMALGNQFSILLPPVLNDRKILFNLHAKLDESIEATGGVAKCGIFLLGKDYLIGDSLLMDPKAPAVLRNGFPVKDPILGKYLLDGELQKQPIHGIIVPKGHLESMYDSLHPGVFQEWFKDNVQKIIKAHTDKNEIEGDKVKLTISDLIYLTSLERYFRRQETLIKRISDFLRNKNVID